MIDAVELVVLVTTVAYIVLALVAAVVHVRQRSSSSLWLLIAFAAMGVALGMSQLLRLLEVEDPPLVAIAALGAALLFFPYALFRFSATFERPPRLAELGAALLALGVVGGLPVLLLVGEDSPLVTLYLVLVLVYWTALSLHVVVRLWRSSARRSTLARRRLRLMASAAALLNIALLLSVLLVDRRAAADVLVQGIAILSSLLFLLGFAPPPFVRRAWRSGDDELLRDAERRLLGATDRAEVMDVVMPALEELFGGRARVIGQSDDDTTDDQRPGGRMPRPGEVAVGGDRVAVGLQRSTLEVRADAYTPFFGTEEILLLQAFGASVDLALSRVDLLAQERAARAEAQRTNDELEALLYGITHDLRTPLVALTGYVELLNEAGASPEERTFALERIRVNTSYMDALIRDLLELSRIGRVQEAPSAVDLGELARDLAGELALQHGAARVEVGALPVVDMEPTRARQLLSNLLINAARHSRRDDVTIRLRATQVEGGTEISIADDGVGIAPEHREQVFGIFERLQGRDDRGTGIGLAICRKIVEQVEGRIWIADAAVGTDVRIFMPASKARSTRSLELSP